ncbi:MAG: hypothetical protein JRH20_18125 [Deltaproteobacteria bacterium]|nr:hypothetical protein [Deltaproteobacteria bacterium]
MGTCVAADTYLGSGDEATPTTAHKGAEELAKKLAPFSGVLVADAEHRHNAVFAGGSCTGRVGVEDHRALEPRQRVEL